MSFLEKSLLGKEKTPFFSKVWRYKSCLPCKNGGISTICIASPSSYMNNILISGVQSHNFLYPTFSKKSGGTLFLAFCGAWFWIFSRYLVPLTPPTVFVGSFWKLIGAFKMVWRYTCDFFRILKLFLSLFTHFELRHFLSSNITEVYRE